MSDTLVRIFSSVDLQEVKEHLLVYGTLAASCAQCNEMGLKLDMDKCPKCQTEFRYITFRNHKEHMPKILKLYTARPGIKIIDYEDYKKLTGKRKAEELFE